MYTVLMYTITLPVPHRYLVTGDAMTTIAYNFRIGVSTARKIILDVSTAIWDALASIYLPVPSERWVAFYCWWIFHEVEFPKLYWGYWWEVHVMIQCPDNSGSLFYNYKSYFSNVLLAGCFSRLQVCYGGYWCLQKQQW